MRPSPARDRLENILRARVAQLRGAGWTYETLASRMRHVNGERYHPGTLRNFASGSPAGVELAEDLIRAFPAEMGAPPVKVCPCCKRIDLFAMSSRNDTRPPDSRA